MELPPGERIRFPLELHEVSYATRPMRQSLFPTGRWMLRALLQDYSEPPSWSEPVSIYLASAEECPATREVDHRLRERYYSRPQDVALYGVDPEPPAFVWEAWKELEPSYARMLAAFVEMGRAYRAEQLPKGFRARLADRRKRGIWADDLSLLRCELAVKFGNQDAAQRLREAMAQQMPGALWRLAKAGQEDGILWQVEGWAKGWEFRQARDKPQPITCQRNIAMLATLLRRYADEHDQTFPSADSWCDVILPYIQNEPMLTSHQKPEQYFICPAAPDLKCGYAFNEAFSGQKLDFFQIPSEKVLLFDSSLGQWNAHDRGASLAARHEGEVYVAYSDGRAKRISVDQAKAALPP